MKVLKQYSYLLAWLFGLAGLAMMPQIVFWPAALWFTGYVFYAMHRNQ